MTRPITPLYPADKYTYRVVWSEDDQQYVGVCTEFPSLSHLADTHDEALKGIIDLVRDVLGDLRVSKEKAPVPLLVAPYEDKR